MYYEIKYSFSSKNKECFGVNILNQIIRNSVSELSDFKKFRPQTRQEEKGPKRPLLTTLAGANNAATCFKSY